MDKYLKLLNLNPPVTNLIKSLLVMAIFTLTAPVFAGAKQVLIDVCYSKYAAKDYYSALHVCKQPAEQGDADAQYFLGFMYYKGEGTPKDDKQAAYWFTKAAEQGSANAQYILGLIYYHGEGTAKDYKQAFYWLTKAAEQGNAGAKFNLGVMYYKSEGTPKDDKQVFYWLTKAAEQGHADAQYYLGSMYVSGEGTPKDDKQALYWFTKAAEQGHADAQENLNGMYAKSNRQELENTQDNLSVKQDDAIDTRKNYHVYKMFNKFKIVAPSNPILIKTPKNSFDIEFYFSKDEEKNILFTIKKTISGYRYDIGEYEQDTKNSLDATLIQAEDLGGYKIISFSSIFDRKNNMYVATIFSAPKNRDENQYKAIKHIIKGKQAYVWAVMSHDKNDAQTTFNGYKNLIKIE